MITTTTNYKSKIIEWSQKENKKAEYQVVKINGNQRYREFVVVLQINDAEIAQGKGSTRKKPSKKHLKMLAKSSKLQLSQLNLRQITNQMSSIKIAGATLNQTPLDWKGNQERIIAAINEAKSKQVELLCFPELAITGYGAEDLFLSQWFPQKAVSQLSLLLPHCEGITIAIGLPIRIGEKIYNTVAVIENSKIKGIVAKQFMAIDGVHYEFRWFTLGSPMRSLNTNWMEKKFLLEI
ncbi:glutamine-dependent D(+) synthetase [Daphnia sinensis]|uniref:Glutamine-dependent NAD(+) synthetase n=1 Tax=Daphnia sinensis TaxID=1820382 RepID=A0AAD5PL58_9CRUS|nr:glutamine-dependent D(+) synthetase [Daphnia sinensis]